MTSYIIQQVQYHPYPKGSDSWFTAVPLFLTWSDVDNTYYARLDRDTAHRFSSHEEAYRIAEMFQDERPSNEYGPIVYAVVAA